MALCCEIVYLIRTNLRYNLDNTHGVAHVSKMEMEVWLTFEMCYTLTKIGRCATDHAMYFISFFKQEFTEVATVLTGYTCY